MEKKKIFTKSEIEDIISFNGCESHFDKVTRTMTILGATSANCYNKIIELKGVMTFKIAYQVTPATDKEIENIVAKFRCTHSTLTNLTQVLYIFGKNTLFCYNELMRIGVPYTLRYKAVQLV